MTDIAYICPTCRSDKFLEGPRGGLSVNVKCAGCGRKWCYLGPFGWLEIDNDNSLYKGEPKKIEEIA